MECFEELRSESKPNTQESNFAFITSTDNKKDAQSILDCARYSNFDKIIRIVAFILRFVKNCRKQSKIVDTNLTVPELKEVEICVIKDMQRLIITDPNFGQLKGQLNLFVDEHNLIRLKGRFNNSDLHLSTKYPILIPGKHELTTLIIKQCHHAVLHNGLKQTLAQVRTKYWIIRGRQIVKSVISKCTTCKRHQGTPVLRLRLHYQNSEFVSVTHLTKLEIFAVLFTLRYQMKLQGRQK